MSDKNIQIRHRVGEKWGNLYPLTLTENIFNEKGEPEIMDARNGAPSLNARLDEERTQVTAQLQQIPDLPNTFASASGVRMIAHRGLNYLAPENTIPAYELAAKAGFWGGETDVSITADGHWILMHDDTVDRTTNGTGAVSSLTLEQIKALMIDAGNRVVMYPNLRVPTLIEFLVACKKFGIVPVIEIKAVNNSNDYDRFVEIVKNYGFEGKCIVISFSQSVLQEIRNRSSKIMIQALLDITVPNLEFVKSLGNASINISSASVTRSAIELAHSYGILVNTWVSNSYQEVKKFADYGIDFISSDIIPEVTF